MGSTECGHSGLKCTPRRAPASRYIVAFVLGTISFSTSGGAATNRERRLMEQIRYVIIASSSVWINTRVPAWTVDRITLGNLLASAILQQHCCQDIDHGLRFVYLTDLP